MRSSCTTSPSTRSVARWIMKSSVAVARHDLGRHRLGLEAEPAERARLDRRREVGVGADRPGDLAESDVLSRSCKAGPAALHLGTEAREDQPEGGGLCVDAVGAAD